MQSGIFGANQVRRAFSLVEMMVVLLILAVVLAIVVPALSSARNTAKKAATTQLLTQLTNACSQFTMDERRQPGYFSAADMGHMENGGRGFSAMNNILLDLSGGIVTSGGTGVIQAGPRNAGTVYLNPSMIGASRQVTGVTKRAYFQPDAKTFMVVAGKVPAGNPHEQLPDLVDTFGMPILAWAQDDVPAVGATFARGDSTQRAKFYVMQNAVFLTSAGLGRRQIDQRMQSVIGWASGVPGANIVDSMMGILGNPAFPVDPNAPVLVPSAARASLVFQSAGYNSVYVGREERGGKLADANGGTIRYTTAKDAMDDFDDILAKVSN